MTFTGKLLLLSTDQEMIAAGNVIDAHAEDFVVNVELLLPILKAFAHNMLPRNVGCFQSACSCSSFERVEEF